MGWLRSYFSSYYHALVLAVDVARVDNHFTALAGQDERLGATVKLNTIPTTRRSNNRTTTRDLRLLRTTVKMRWLLWTKSGLFRRQTNGRGNAAALKYLPWRGGRLSTTPRTSTGEELRATLNIFVAYL